jgi:hypothetical protein
MRYTLILVLIILFLFTMCIAVKKKGKEGFESYHNCLKQGYPQNFCLNVPAQSMINAKDAESCGLPFYKL